MTIPFARTAILLFALSFFASCASVPMASVDRDAASKTFQEPPADKAGLYVYRDSFVGKGVKRKVSLDGWLIGATANAVYFYRVISPGAHTLSTESEFSDNSLQFVAEPNRNYYFQQHIKMGVFSGGATLTAMDEEEGKDGVLGCDEAIGAPASDPFPPGS